MKRLKAMSTSFLSIFFIYVSTAIAAGESFEAGWKHYQQGSFIDALQNWVPLAAEGNPAAQFNLSIMYEQGRGVPIDLETARYWLEKSIQSNYGPALHNYGLELLDQDRKTEAISVLKRAAEHGSAGSLYTLGKIYQYGVAVGENPRKAFKLVSMAATEGHDKAQYNLGKMYRDGYGVAKDDMSSFKWFRSAALQGNIKAQSHLATRYGKGVGVKRDDVKALKWAILAAMAGNNTAYMNMQALKRRMSLADRKTSAAQAAKFAPSTN